jgi:hypothetical protein
MRSARLWELLRSVQSQGWKDILTFDAARVDFSNQDEQIGLPDSENRATIDRQTISSPKTMLTVVWPSYGFHLTNVLPQGPMWTSQY